MFKEGLLKGKRILITGGGTGLGKEIAAKYVQLGAEVWICGRRGGVLEETAKSLGGNVRTHAVDIRDAAGNGTNTAFANITLGTFIARPQPILSSLNPTSYVALFATTSGSWCGRAKQTSSSRASGCWCSTWAAGRRTSPSSR